MNVKSLYLLIAVLIFASLFWFALSFWKGQRTDQQLQKADANYEAGERVKTIVERKDHFNRALEIYLSLEKEYQPAFGNGKLYYNIGNTYYQLEEYPWAILYYSRAQNLMPREEKVRNNLKSSREKLSLQTQEKTNPFRKVFFFHSYFSLPERLQLFFLFAFCGMFLYSVLIWYKNNWVKSALLVTLICLFFITLSLGYSRYFSPMQAVLVHSVHLRRDAGMQYATVGEQPLPGGSEVEILNVLDEGRWIKVITSSGDLGYVPQESIRLI